MIVPGHQLACLLNQEYDDDNDTHNNNDVYDDDGNDDIHDIETEETARLEDECWFRKNRRSIIVLPTLFIFILGSYEFGHFMGRSENSCSTVWSPAIPIVIIFLLIFGILWMFASIQTKATDLNQTNSICQEISSLLGQIHAPPLEYYRQPQHGISSSNNITQGILEFTKCQVDLCLAYENAMTCIQYATLYPYTHKVPNTTSFFHHFSKNRNVLLQCMIRHYTLLYNALPPENQQNHNNLTQEHKQELIIPDNSTLQYYSKEIRQLLSETLSYIMTSSFSSTGYERKDFITISIQFCHEQIQYIHNYYPLFQKNNSQRTTKKKIDRHLVQLQSRMEAATVSLWSLVEFINTTNNSKCPSEPSIHQLWSQFQTLFQDCQRCHDFLLQEYSDVLTCEGERTNDDDQSVHREHVQNQQIIPTGEESLHYSSQGVTPKEIIPILDVKKEQNTLIFSAIGELQKRRISTRTTKRETKSLSAPPLPKNNHYFLHELTSTLANREYPMEEESTTTATAKGLNHIAIKKQKSEEIRSPSFNLGLSNSLLQELKNMNIPSPNPTINSDEDNQIHSKIE